MGIVTDSHASMWGGGVEDKVRAVAVGVRDVGRDALKQPSDLGLP